MSYFCMRAPLQTAMGGTDAGGAGSGVPAGAAPPAHPASCTIGHPWRKGGWWCHRTQGHPRSRARHRLQRTFSCPKGATRLPRPTPSPWRPSRSGGGAPASLPAVPRRARVGWVPPRTDEAGAAGAASGPGCSRSGEQPAPNRRARRWAQRAVPGVDHHRRGCVGHGRPSALGDGALPRTEQPQEGTGSSAACSGMAAWFGLR